MCVTNVCVCVCVCVLHMCCVGTVYCFTPHLSIMPHVPSAPSLHTKQDDDFVLVHASPRDSIGGGADGSYPPMLIPDTGATQV